jgi:hypothetical protein
MQGHGAMKKHLKLQEWLKDKAARELEAEDVVVSTEAREQAGQRKKLEAYYASMAGGCGADGGAAGNAPWWIQLG